MGLWTPQQEGVWERASFTVPMHVPDERVQFLADRYMRRFGNKLEQGGFEVLQMTRPAPDKGVFGKIADRDRRCYVMWAWVRRRPQTIRLHVPDRAVPALLKQGLRLVN